MRPRGLVFTALVAAAVLAPAAAASPRMHAHPRLRLELVPLQTAQLGSAGAALPIQVDSGTVRNRDVSPSLKKLGRLSGYQLDYGDPYTGGAGVTAIQTQAERFRTAKGARKGLGYWKKNDTLDAALFRELGVAGDARFFKAPAAGSGHFAYVMSLRVPNADPVYMVDEEASSGSFVLHATVAAGTESTAERLAPRLTAKLVHRLHLLLAGRLHGTSAKLPRVPTPGPPPGGPDLSTLVVGPADFSGAATVADQGYGVDPGAISTYALALKPAGPFDSITQSIGWYGNANETTWHGTLLADILSLAASEGSTAVDVSASGDNAYALIAAGTDSYGNPISLAFVVMWRGQALDLVVAENSTPIQPADVQALAQAMSRHLDAGLAG